MRVPPYLVRKREGKKERLETLYIGKVLFHAAEQHRKERKKRLGGAPRRKAIESEGA